jgi:O-methyltransferase involved in polyketide biosynthesis
LETDKVHLAKEKETLLATLYGKALDYRSRDPILGDNFANDVVQKIDYDFNKFKLGSDTMSIALRAKYLDLWTREFLAANPVSTVLHLGCGLDSRVFRIDPLATVRWYDVDYPEVIELRKRLYPERHDYYMIGSSVTAHHWLDEIPVDRPVLVVAEGLVMYLSEKEGVKLFRRITDHFTGGQFIFDAASRMGIRLSKLVSTIRVTGASMGWGIDDPRELEKFIPRLNLVTEFSFMDVPELKRLSRVERQLWHVMDSITFLKRMTRLLRYNF